MTFLASIQESLSAISLSPMLEGLSLIVVAGGGVGGMDEGPGTPTGRGSEPKEHKSEEAGITVPIIDETTKHQGPRAQNAWPAPHCHGGMRRSDQWSASSHVESLTDCEGGESAKDVSTAAPRGERRGRMHP